MLRWIVSLTALIAVTSVFAQNGSFGVQSGQDSSLCPPTQDIPSNKGSFCDPTPTKPSNNSYCNPKPPTNCDPKPPANCVPEPASVATLAIGGLGLLVRKRKKTS